MSSLVRSAAIARTARLQTVEIGAVNAQRSLIRNTPAGRRRLSHNGYPAVAAAFAVHRLGGMAHALADFGTNGLSDVRLEFDRGRERDLVRRNDSIRRKQIFAHPNMEVKAFRSRRSFQLGQHVSIRVPCPC